MSGFSAFVLITGNIFLGQYQMEIVCSTQYLFHWYEITHLRINLVMAAIELHLYATYAQHLALKSVYEKKEYIIGGKLISCSTMLELTHL